MFSRIRTAWEDIKAWRRNERRLTPHGVRGRVYEKVDMSGEAHQVKQVMTYRVTARVIRADGRPDEHYVLTR